MEIKGKIGTGNNQLWWVVLLLAVAVILPTICLLWFMSQAVKNERLAVQQKLTDVYRQRMDKLNAKIDDLWSARIGLLERQAAESQHAEMFYLLAGPDQYGESDERKMCDAVIVYDSSAKLVYPVTIGAEYADDAPEELNPAWTAEFIEADFAKAVNLYEGIAGLSTDDYIRYSALMGRIRCLRKLGQIDKAITLCRELAYGRTPESISSSSVSLITRARILLIDLKSETG